MACWAQSNINFKRGRIYKLHVDLCVTLFNWTHVIERFMTMLVAMTHT